MARKTFTDLFRLIQGKFTKEIPGIDPTIKGSITRSVSLSSAAAGISLQEGIADAQDQSFWQTSDDDFLELHGNYDKTFRYGAQVASGFASAPGVLTTIVPQDFIITYAGNSYVVLNDSAVQNYSQSISLSFSAGIVTAITTAEHTLASGLEVIISGATQTDYNGTFDITVLDNNTFTYELTAGALTTDNGTYSTDYALLNLESQGTGLVQNAESGAVMSFSLTNMDGTALVTSDGISGGLEQESIEDYRVRVGENHNITPGIATPPSLVGSAKSIPGNTRVFVVRPDGSIGGTPGVAGYKPELGETVLYILRDNDPSITPSSEVLTTTKDQILADGLWPSNVPDEHLYVLAPILKTQDFAFTSITPNTVTMQNAITDQLTAFFEDNAEIEGTITLEQINVFLRQVQDLSTGALLTAFTYTNPSGSIVAASGEIYTRGDVTFV